MATSGITVTGMDRLQNAMNRLQVQMGNPSGVMRIIAMRMKSMQMSHFREEVDSAGKKWPALDPQTLAQRGRIKRKRSKRGKSDKRKGRDPGKPRGPRVPRTARAPRILQDTGRLRTSITMRSTFNLAVVGTNVVYAPVHQFGFPRGKIPKREFLYIDIEERNVLIRTLEQELLIDPLTGRT